MLTDCLAPTAAVALGIMLTVAEPSPGAQPENRPVAEREPLVTDRPDFTESAAVVPRGWWQLETGFESAACAGRGVEGRTIVSPLPLLRLGLGRGLELRLSGVNYLWRGERSGEGGGAPTRGVTDLEIGMKVKVLEEDVRRPAVAVIPFVTLPTGSPEFSQSGYEPAIVLAWAKALPLGFEAGGNLGLARVTEERRRFSQKAASISVSHALPLTALSGFLETYTVGPDTPHGPMSWTAAGGVTAALGVDAQVDFYVARGFRGPFRYWAFGAGFSFRRPFGILGRRPRSHGGRGAPAMSGGGRH